MPFWRIDHQSDPTTDHLPRRRVKRDDVSRSTAQDRMIHQAIPGTPPPPYQIYDQGAISLGCNTAVEPNPSQSRQQKPRKKDSSKTKDAPTTTRSRTSRLPPRISETLVQDDDWHGAANSRAHSVPEAYRESPVVRSMNQSAALCDRIAAVTARLNEVFTHIDSGETDDEGIDLAPRSNIPAPNADVTQHRAKRTVIDFQKTWMYANSRLPPYLPPYKVYIATWQIICAAAQASNDVYYRRPWQAASNEDYVNADVWRGTKAMVLRSRCMEDKRLVVLAIRGSKGNLVDWAVNFRPAPTAPTGFLDDAGNACHAGFLGVARNMVGPVAAHLRRLLARDEFSVRTAAHAWSLLFTGHSAGGAVASLLYAHMLATTVDSELRTLAGCFKRIHCVTFGAPPLSFLPLKVPSGVAGAERSVFVAFANEGDLVVRADRQYVHTLVRLLATPAPSVKTENGRQHRTPATWWEVPASTLSNAGRMVLLRKSPQGRQMIEAVQVTDEDLRVHVFGDPAMHSMELYKSRLDELAVAAVTGQRME